MLAILTYKRTNTDAAGYTLDIIKATTSPANADGVGTINFRSNDSAGPIGTLHTYATMKTSIADVATASKDGKIELQVQRANTLTTAIAIDDEVDVTGVLNVSGIINANATTASTSTATGALIVDGGAGIAGKLFVGSDFDIGGNFNVTASNGNTDIDGTLVVNDTTDASSSTTGSVIIDGGVGIAKKLYVGTDLDVTGNTVLDGNLTIKGNFDLGDASTDTFTIVSTLDTPKINIRNTEAGTGSATNQISFFHDTTSPADGDWLGSLAFEMDNATVAVDGGAKALMNVRATTLTGGSEATRFDFLTASGTGTTAQRLSISNAITTSANIVPSGTIDIGLTGTRFNHVYSDNFTGTTFTGAFTGNVSGSSGSTTGNAASATHLKDGAANQIPYQSGTGATSYLAANTTTTQKFLAMTGNGSAGAAPVWDTLDASAVDSGTFADARIPSLGAGKITSGTFADARIPSLAASKINSGTFAAARIPSITVAMINAGAIQTGTELVNSSDIVDSDTQLLTAAAVKNFVEGKGYATAAEA